MPIGSKDSDPRIEREQGDVNTTENRRKYWDRNLTGESKNWFDADKTYFLHQSLSTPVLNVIARAEGPFIEDLNGKKYIDMHGNGVHNAGFNNRRKCIDLATGPGDYPGGNGPGDRYYR